MPGGIIADRFLPRYILFSSLLLTSIGGLFFLFNPNFLGLCIIYGFWGITTILFFWAALIKATSQIAGNRQGFSFGLLEGGRGLVASLCASFAVIIYSSNIFVDCFSYLFSKKVSSLSVVIFFYSLLTFLAAFMILFLFKDSKVKRSLNMRTKIDKNRKHSPLVRVKDSILIRSDKLSKKEVINKMSFFVDKHLLSINI